MDIFCTLDSLSEGASARVKHILSTGNIRRRFLDLGIIEGTRITCLQKSSGGDIAAYAIRGAVIALRSEDSRNILIDREGSN